MQLSTFETLHDWNFTDKNVMIGLSGGINSAAVLCYLVKHIQNKPKKLFLFHADFAEHSPDTLTFVMACIEYAKKHFDVEYEIQSNSALDFFEQSKMIPAPTLSPCTRILKIEPMVKYMRDNNIDVDLVGYVRTEDRRIINQIARKIGIKRKVTKGKFLAIQQIIETVELLTSDKDKADFKERLKKDGRKEFRTSKQRN